MVHRFFFYGEATNGVGSQINTGAATFMNTVSVSLSIILRFNISYPNQYF